MAERITQLALFKDGALYHEIEGEEPEAVRQWVTDEETGRRRETDRIDKDEQGRTHWTLSVNIREMVFGKPTAKTAVVHFWAFEAEAEETAVEFLEKAKNQVRVS